MMANTSTNDGSTPHEQVSEVIAAMVMQKGHREGAAFINDECVNGQTDHLNCVLDVILNPEKNIDNLDSIEWCKWLIAGGRTPDEFASIVRTYDNHAKCGLVWVPHVVAYRCRTCGISPCMSICRNCFKKGDHSTHDFNMFLSQAGGACDCGDTSVMKAEGFCSDHGINNHTRNSLIPNDLMAVAQAIMPRLLLRLLFHFRNDGDIKACDSYFSMLMELNNIGELMRNVMTATLLDKSLYTMLLNPNNTKSFSPFLVRSIIKYKEAKSKLKSPMAPSKYKDFAALQSDIVHSSLLEELIFWTFKYEFPQNFVCFLLNMLPDPEYKEQLTRTFVMHYSRIPKVLETSSDPDNLSNRVVHMSVQLFSNESLALKMVEELNLLHVMIISLKSMMSQNLIRNTLHDETKNRHYVIDCATKAMKEHCYWPLVSDFNNVLSHESVALVFLRDDDLVNMWFQFLSMLQGMNVNVREIGSHVEYEPNSYYAAFSCELEASAYPMWSIISHLNDSTHAQLAKKIIMFCTNYLQDWLKAIYQSQLENEIIRDEKNDMMRASFHFPLHRYLAAFTCQAVSKMNMTLKDIIPPPDLLTLLMVHPLRVQSFFYEILAGTWIRNGVQIKGQAMTYIQANFCNSMVDMDLYFLQICAIQLPPKVFLLNTIEAFDVMDWLSMCQLSQPQEMEQDSMMEGLLTFLLTIVSSRTNLGNDEKAQCIIEISALLATGDKTHSQLLELMPERSGNTHTRNFERHLSELSMFKKPQRSENLEQGLFMPTADVWERYYDPLHVLLRAVQRRDFQNSMDRFQNYVKQEKKMPKSGNLWPPFRLPPAVGECYSDPSCILHSRIMHSTILGILYRAVHLYNVSEHMLSLAIFLLEIAVTSTNRVPKDALECNQNANAYNAGAEIPELLNVYSGDCLAANLRHHVSRIALTPVEPQNSPANYSNTTFDSDIEWDVSENEPLQTLMPNNAQMDMDMEEARFDVAIPQDLTIIRDRYLALRNNDSMDASSEASSQGALQPYTTLPNNDTVHAIEYNRRDSDPEPSGSTHLALPAAQVTIETSGMEVVVRRNVGLVPSDETQRPQTEMFSHANPGTILPFQRVQPVAVPSRNMDIVASTGNNQRRALSSQFKAKIVEGGMSDSDFIVIEESILSLLLKLHSQLSGILDSFSLDELNDENKAATAVASDDMDTSEAGPSSSNASQSNHRSGSDASPSESRIGDGPYFIGCLLKKIAKADAGCAQSINEIRQRLWPNQREKQAEQKAKETKEKEDRSKRARERQQKIMEEMANKQKRFMEQTSEIMDYDTEPEPVEEVTREKEYDCIICNLTSPSTEDNPIGLVVLIESSGVIGHRRKHGERFNLPLTDVEAKTMTNERFATECTKRNQLLTRHFGEESWFLTSNNSFESGIFVQSCGHYVHLECHKAYVKSLSSQRQQSLSVERGEFLCPVCRQLANAVLPLRPQTETPTSVVRTKDETKKDHLFKSLLKDLTGLIRENRSSLLSKTSPPTKLRDAMNHAMEIISGSTHPKLVDPSWRRLFLFVTSIARTNVEAEVIQRGGSLCSKNALRYKPKRECLVPLLSLLSEFLRFLAKWPLECHFVSLYEVQSANTASVPAHCEEIIPNLLADPIALLIKYTLMAPLRMDIFYFTCIVKVMYNLLYFQVIVKLCLSLTEAECDQILAKYAPNESVEFDGFSNLGMAMAFVLRVTNKCHQFRAASSSFLRPRNIPMPFTFPSTSSSPSSSSSSSSSQQPINLNVFEQQLQKLCLPFLRIAALLRHHLYEQNLPEIEIPQVEFVRLVYFLELVTVDIDWNSFDAAKALCFIPGHEQKLPELWCIQLMNLHRGALADLDDQFQATSSLISSQHALWEQPRLLRLPREYEKLFTFYHEKVCENCNNIPRECSICLLCGTIVCLKQRCCVEDSCFEAVRHSMQCGGGTGIFLVIPTTYIIVIRGRRACLWGSLYLDDYFEEDRDLRRGRPLYLSEERFNLLESQWLSHRFAHTKHTWVLHKDTL